MTGLPLAGLRVIEFGALVAAPFTGKLLAEAGADVLKIEPPGLGDEARSWGPFPGHLPDSESSALFLYANAGKRSITLAVETVEGRHLLRRLLETADVFLHDLQPARATALGLEDDALLRSYPRLVPAAVTPFGQTGPYADLPGTDLTVQALGGLMGITGLPARDPLMGYGFQAQYQAGLAAYVAILAALESREQTGRTDAADISWQESMAATADVVSQLGARGSGARRMGNRYDRTGPLIDLYPTADGYVSISVSTEAQWQGLTVAVGHPEWQDEPRHSTWEGRIEDPEVEHHIAGWCRSVSTAEAMEVLQTLRVPSAPLLGVEDLLHDAQADSRGLFADVAHPRAGAVRYPARAMLTEGMELRYGRAPLLGEHNVEIYAELGLSPADLEHLRALGVL